MCDPVKRPITWNKKFYVYAERHGLYDVIQGLMKELAIWRPDDPLNYIKNEIKRIGASIYSPKVFMIGPQPLSPLLAEGISNHCGAKFFTIKGIIQNTTHDIRVHLMDFMNEEDNGDDYQRKLLISTIARRLVGPDVIKAGYVLFGFPQSRRQALMAQACGLIPKQVFVLMPNGPPPDSTPAGTKPSSANSADFTDLFSEEKLKVQYTPAQLEMWKEFFAFKDTATAFSQETLKVQSYHHWHGTDPHDLEAEFLSVLITKPNTGAPWIPRIILLGPPGSGKRTIGEKLGERYKIPHFCWIDIIRGALAFDDDHADECKMYLDNFTPLSDQCVSALLKRRLYRDDVLKMGFVLSGFPQTPNEAVVLDDVALSPNRVFLLSCPESVSTDRLSVKRNEVMSRVVPNHPLFYKNPKVLEFGGEGDGPSESFGQNPYDEAVVKTRMEHYNQNLPGVLRHYGSSTIYVDASEELNVVMKFVLASTLRPPNVRFE